MVLVGSLFVFLTLVPQQNVKADQKTTKSDFEVQPVLPDNQANMSVDYFDLKMSPNKSQKIQMRIQNFTGKQIKVRSNLRNAYTQDGGGIDFSTDRQPQGDKLKVPFNTVAKLPKDEQVITLKPHQAKVLTADIKMPKQNNQGMIYGDWHFDEHTNTKTHASAAVTANYDYSVGVMLRGKDFSSTLADLKYEGVSPYLYHKHPAVGIKLRNPKAMAFHKANVKAEISRKGDNGMTRSFVGSNSSFLVAPNSTLRLPISWNYDSMKPGTYMVKVTFKGKNYSNDYPMTYNFRKEFKISNDEATSLNKQAVKKPKNKWLYVSVATGIVWLISVAGLIKVIKMK